MMHLPCCLAMAIATTSRGVGARRLELRRPRFRNSRTNFGSTAIGWERLSGPPGFKPLERLRGPERFKTAESVRGAYVQQ